MTLRSTNNQYTRRLQHKIGETASTQFTFSSFDRRVNQRGSGELFVLGVIPVVIGIIIGSSLDNIAVSIIAILGTISIIASFLFTIKQYERSIILRLGKYNRQVGPGMRTRFPFIEIKFKYLVANLSYNVYLRRGVAYCSDETDISQCGASTSSHLQR
jgi:hypothetical protein